MSSTYGTAVDAARAPGYGEDGGDLTPGVFRLAPYDDEPLPAVTRAPLVWDEGRWQEIAATVAAAPATVEG